MGAGQCDLDELDLVAEHRQHRISLGEPSVAERVDQSGDPLVELSPAGGATVVDHGGLVAS